MSKIMNKIQESLCIVLYNTKITIEIVDNSVTVFKLMYSVIHRNIKHPKDIKDIIFTKQDK